MKSLNIVKRNYDYLYLEGWKEERNKKWVNQNMIERQIHRYTKLIARWEAIEKEIDNLHAQNPNNNLIILCFSNSDEDGCLWSTRRIACHSVQDAIETYETLSAEAHRHHCNTTGVIELRSQEEERRVEELQSQITELRVKLDSLMEEFDTLTKEEEDNEY